MSPSTGKRIHIIGVPLDHGAGRRGVGMGPSALRLGGLHAAIKSLGYELEDHGDINVPAPETQPLGHVNAKYLTLISAVCSELHRQVRQVLDEGQFPLVLGGDHSIAIGTISGIAAHMRSQSESKPPKLGVIWFDAHGDINTPQTSPSGNVHGMPVSCLLNNGPEELTCIGFAGAKVPPQNFVQIGVRDVDRNERRLLRESGIRTMTMAHVDRKGMAASIAEAIEIASDGTDMLHVSFDIDALDPRVAPGTGTTKIGGLTYREAHLALEMIAESGNMTSFEMVEINPTLDVGNQTAELAVELISSALGRTIL